MGKKLHNPPDLEDPCSDFKCEAGSECLIDPESNEPKCECINECGYEENPRRRVRLLAWLQL